MQTFEKEISSLKQYATSNSLPIFNNTPPFFTAPLPEPAQRAVRLSEF